MYELEMTAAELVSALLALSASETVCILDSCGIRHLGSHLLIAGIEPLQMFEVTNVNADESLRFLDEQLAGNLASIFTISYDFGLKLLGIPSRAKPFQVPTEPDFFFARFDVLLIHDYTTGRTSLAGNAARFDAVRRKLENNISNFRFESSNEPPEVSSNFTKAAYLDAIEKIKELIRQGDTYQANLTQQLTAKLPIGLTPETIFARLRKNHPAPFSAFIKRPNSTIVSASPERFFRVEGGGNPTLREGADFRKIRTSPIKGTRRRGESTAEDAGLRDDLSKSPKDRAENTMIVDLLRNDLGRVCAYGSVRVESLCELEEHPTLFHLVSTVGGDLRPHVQPSDLLKAVFPCGSITGAPKISTMRIIDEIETVNRGLSMGAIGYHIPPNTFGTPETLDLSVAIRTMTICDHTATFNVGGGIVIDSDPETEYAESLLKAKALLLALGVSSELEFR